MKKVREILLRFHIIGIFHPPEIIKPPNIGDKTDENLYITFNVFVLLYLGMFFYWMWLLVTEKSVSDMLKAVNLLLATGSGFYIVNLIREIRYRSKSGIVFAFLLYILIIASYMGLRAMTLISR